MEEKVEYHYWGADGCNEELLKHFIIDIGSDDSNDNISDGGENVNSMEEGDSAEDVCIYNSLFYFYHLYTVYVVSWVVILIWQFGDLYFIVKFNVRQH